MDDDNFLDSLLNPTKRDAIILSPKVVICPSCETVIDIPIDYDPTPRMVFLDELVYSVMIDSMEQEHSSWLTKGSIICPTCGYDHTIFVRLIPYHFKKDPCPKCGSNEHIDCSIDRITRQTGKEFTYKFSVRIRCLGCSKSNIFKRIVDALSQVSELEITLTGIKVKRASSAEHEDESKKES